jgi:hypothetical protein
MVQGGLSVEKMQGSAWKFSLGSDTMERPIQFHEPHPDPKLRSSWARRYGTRLERAYGWSVHMAGLAIASDWNDFGTGRQVSKMDETGSTWFD